MSINIAGFSERSTIRNTEGVLVPLYNYIFKIPDIKLKHEHELTYELLIKKLNEDKQIYMETQEHSSHIVAIDDLLTKITIPTNGKYTFTFTDVSPNTKLIYTIRYEPNQAEKLAREQAEEKEKKLKELNDSIDWLRTLNFTSALNPEQIKFYANYLLDMKNKNDVNAKQEFEADKILSPDDFATKLKKQIIVDGASAGASASASSTHAPSGPTVYVDPSVTALRNLQINSVPASKYIKYKSKYLQLKKLLQQI